MISERIQSVGQEVTLPQATLRTETARLKLSLISAVISSSQIKTILAMRFFDEIRSDECPYAVKFDVKGSLHELQSIRTDGLHSITVIIKDKESTRELRMHMYNPNSQEPSSCEIVFKEVKKDGTITIANTQKAVAMGSGLIKEFVQAANTPYVPHT